MSDTHESASPSKRKKPRPRARAGWREPVRCTARSSRTGEPCKRFACHGQVVCATHGGRAPQSKAAALRRLQQALDPLAQRLLALALDQGVPEHVALSAINSAMDRAGLSAKTTVEVDVGVKPYERVFAGMAQGITRDESRRRRGLPITPAPALPATDGQVIDAEIVEPDGTVLRPECPADGSAAPGANDGPKRKRPPPWTGEPMPERQRRPGTELVTLDEAVAEQAAERRRRGRYG